MSDNTDEIPRAEYLLSAVWCAWQLGVMLVHLDLRQAARRLVCIGRCLWWGIIGESWQGETMSSYTFVNRLGKMPVLEHYLYESQIWTLIKTRKAHKCAICRIEYEAGDGMFRPITNAINRLERICPVCMDKLTGDSDGRATT